MGVKVRERPKDSGVWWIFIDHKGKRKAKRVGSEEAARKAAKLIEAKLTLGDVGVANREKPKAPTFKEYAELWLRGYVKRLRRETTFERYAGILRQYVYPAIGKLAIDEVTRKDVRDLLLGLYNKGLSKGSVCLTRDVLSGPFAHAIDDEIIESNPVQGVVKRLQLTRNKTSEIEPLTRAEVRLFLETCQEYRPDYYPLFLTAFRCGLRLGELLALQWGDTDWNSRFIRVNRSFKRGRLTPTKTGKTRRVDMSDQLCDVLNALQIRRKRDALQSGTAINPFLFFERNGQPISQNTVRNVFKRILTKAGLREIRIHDIRHSFASLLLSDGQSPVYVKEQLGHSSIQMTVDIYGHLIPSSNREAVNRLDETQPAATYPQPAQIQKA
jgi:integrase